MRSRFNRRRFLQTTAATGAGYFITATAASAARAAAGPNGKIAFAGIGVGGKGSGDISQAGALGDVVAICDIDENSLNGKAKDFPSAKKYFDFRKMLDEMGKNIDAVTVSTPDHTHAPASMMAMKMKKHVYCQKPLTHTVLEARQMRETAAKMGVATQLGNQGSALNGVRRAIEIVQSGVLGKISEAHVWTNRPVWPHAPKIMTRPAETPMPKHVHWDEFIGPSPMRPFADYEETVKDRKTGEVKKVRKGWYHSFNWRGWWDFGTGALGDMSCHTANMAYRALKLGYPTSIVAEATDVNPETFPSSARVKFEFPARGDMVPVTFYWYEGRLNGKKVLPPQELLAKLLKKDEKLADSGSILVGDKGILFSPNDYGAKFRLVPEREFTNVKMDYPEKLPMGTTELDNDPFMKREWVEAIKGGPAAFSNFEIGGMLTETMLLGNVAIRMSGDTLNWDGPAMKFTNNNKANQHLHFEYRKGWTL